MQLLDPQQDLAASSELEQVVSDETPCAQAKWEIGYRVELRPGPPADRGHFMTEAPGRTATIQSSGARARSWPSVSPDACSSHRRSSGRKDAHKSTAGGWPVFAADVAPTPV